MKRLAIIMTVLLTSSGAQANDQLRASVERELPRYGVRVDVDTLSVGQLAAVHSIVNGNHSESEKRSLVRSAVGGSRYSLRGLIFGR